MLSARRSWRRSPAATGAGPAPGPFSEVKTPGPSGTRAGATGVWVVPGLRSGYGHGQAAACFAAVCRPRLAAVLRQHARNCDRRPGHHARWIDRFRQILAAHLDDQALSLPAVARRLGMSPRALQRRLDSDGTSSREEVRMLRYERATRLLREGMPRAAIAAQLGYSDTRAAVRRAHPAPPASFRSPRAA